MMHNLDQKKNRLVADMDQFRESFHEHIRSMPNELHCELIRMLNTWANNPESMAEELASLPNALRAAIAIAAQINLMEAGIADMGHRKEEAQ